MDVIWIALAVMIAASLIVHLGLGEAIAEVMDRVLKCPICLTFWGTSSALYCCQVNIVTILLLSIFTAYLSNYFGLVISMLNILYDKLWALINKKKSKRRKIKNKKLQR